MFYQETVTVLVGIDSLQCCPVRHYFTFKMLGYLGNCPLSLVNAYFLLSLSIKCFQSYEGSGSVGCNHHLVLSLSQRIASIIIGLFLLDLNCILNLSISNICDINQIEVLNTGVIYALMMLKTPVIHALKALFLFDDWHLKCY